MPRNPDHRRDRLAGSGRTTPFVAVVAMLALALACASALERTRRHTYAPSFNYISDEKLESAMWQLASGVATLDRILAPDRVVRAEDRLDVIRTLDRMDQAAVSLGPEGWPSNHPDITQNTGRFREQLARAKRSVEFSPPSYYLAGNISGACLMCHANGD